MLAGVFSVTALLIFGVFLVVWSAIPLQRISTALATEDMTPLRRMEKARTEFGNIARLLDMSIQQKLQLIREMAERERAMESLRQSEARFRTLFEATSDAVLLSTDDTFFECNEAAVRLFGLYARRGSKRAA